MDNDEGKRRARQRGAGESSLPSKLSEPSQKIQTLLEQGEELFRASRYQRAVHVWTRILFLDRGNVGAREAIERGKRAVAEQERQIDSQVVEAMRYLDGGDRRNARRLLEEALSRDRRHREARGLWEKLDALDRRSDQKNRARTGASVPDGATPVRARTRSRSPAYRTGTLPAPPFKMAKMAAFLFCALALFGAGAAWLHLNWDFLVSEGLLSRVRDGSRAAAVEELDLPVLPFPGELHYYNGARLFAKGRYRHALSELARVERQSRGFESARSLIVRIEERLLRGAAQDASAASAPR